MQPRERPTIDLEPATEHERQRRTRSLQSSRRTRQPSQRHRPEANVRPAGPWSPAKPGSPTGVQGREPELLAFVAAHHRHRSRATRAGPSTSSRPTTALLTLARGPIALVRHRRRRAGSGRLLPRRSGRATRGRRRTILRTAAARRSRLGDRRSGNRAPPRGRRRGAGGCRSRPADRESGRPRTRGGTRFSPIAGPAGRRAESRRCLCSVTASTGVGGLPGATAAALGFGRKHKRGRASLDECQRREAGVRLVEHPLVEAGVPALVRDALLAESGSPSAACRIARMPTQTRNADRPDPLERTPALGRKHKPPDFARSAASSKQRHGGAYARSGKPGRRSPRPRLSLRLRERSSRAARTRHCSPSSVAQF